MYTLSYDILIYIFIVLLYNYLSMKYLRSY